MKKISLGFYYFFWKSILKKNVIGWAASVSDAEEKKREGRKLMAIKTCT